MGEYAKSQRATLPGMDVANKHRINLSKNTLGVPVPLQGALFSLPCFLERHAFLLHSLKCPHPPDHVVVRRGYIHAGLGSFVGVGGVVVVVVVAGGGGVFSRHEALVLHTEQCLSTVMVRCK